MTDHVYVDPTSLAQMSVQLGRIARELSGARGSVQEVTAIVENSQIAAAMDRFDSSWRQHRQNLVTSLEDGQRLTAAAADAYTSLDAGLAQQIQTAVAGGTSTSRPGHPGPPARSGPTS